MQSSCSQVLQLKAQEKAFPHKIQKAFLHFWQVMGMSSSKLKIGRSLSSLPIKCQQWGRQIYLSVRISLEGQLWIKLEIDDPQTCSKWGKAADPGGKSAQGGSKMDCATWNLRNKWSLADVSLTFVPRAARGCTPEPVFTWEHPSLELSWLRGGTEWLCLKNTWIGVGLENQNRCLEMSRGGLSSVHKKQHF